MPVLVKSNVAGPTVFSIPSKNIAIDWSASGDPDGNDYQYVPDEVVTDVNFMKAMNRGVFAVVEASDAVHEAIARQGEAYLRRQEIATQAAKDVIDQRADDDLISLSCIGPGSRPGSDCGDQVPVRAKHRDRKPPLCDRHVGMQNIFALVETEEFDSETGKFAKKWVRSTEGAMAGMAAPGSV